MKKYKEKYKPGMIFRSKKYPYADIVIEYVYYMRGVDSTYEFNQNSIIDWTRTNEEAFDKFICKRKGYNYEPDENGKTEEQLAVEYYMKAEEHAMLGRKGAARVLDYYKSGGNIQLTEDDIKRLELIVKPRQIENETAK